MSVEEPAQELAETPDGHADRGPDRTADRGPDPKYFDRRHTAFQWWLKHAPVEDLHAAVSEGSWRTWPVVVDLAYSRRDPWVAEWLNQRVREEHDWVLLVECLALLSSCYQDQLLPAATVLFDRKPERADELALWLADHEEDCPAVTTQIRRVLRERLKRSAAT